jgi:hypothetical protein
MRPSSLWYSVLLSATLTVGLGAGLVGRAVAQPAEGTSYPPCQPPNAGEYLLLVRSPTQTAPDQLLAQLQPTLPSSTTTTVCTYLEDTVLRVGGFSNAEAANTWSQSITNSGLQAFVIRPTPTADSAPIAQTTPLTADSFPAPTPIAPTSPPPTAATASTPAVTQAPAAQAPAAASPSANAYNPQPLGAGYAVLVDYFNHPEVAADIQQLLSREVGLVSYAQRPYLLAVYTADPSVANSILQTLSDRSFVTMIIDSRRAILLSPAVARPPE